MVIGIIKTWVKGNKTARTRNAIQSLTAITTTKQQKAELPKHRPEPDNSEATSSSNGQRRKRPRQGFYTLRTPKYKNFVD